MKSPTIVVAMPFIPSTIHHVHWATKEGLPIVVPIFVFVEIHHLAIAVVKHLDKMGTPITTLKELRSPTMVEKMPTTIVLLKKMPTTVVSRLEKKLGSTFRVGEKVLKRGEWIKPLITKTETSKISMLTFRSVVTEPIVGGASFWVLE
mmetsp:Transcript_26100/g.60228  ORF Transcript_26100/g.60228 Transcript_26100/m.60228 type:complete len:148 (+) Transcript_26100:380-823(+)